ncbi:MULTISPECIES: nickel-dependent hydrogenase large subunit [Dehalobacter]|jgi:hydrogenase large subunit|uniref:nickel-dependent hydrogenase large subunit n=1 Tax=Dehalobacter TaxID=56112 RepID=UPI00028ACE52|nr:MULTISPECIES: nickel-dependent hydrogenase large subunit [unclassified Dehalobacter]AFV02706.1 Hup-type Ni,Fe-hydrogenase large subunit [Dehalobacter sp. DCA]AFV05691.1 Hup-type Ni,Fe-hydrogenase large subunit [Dehalobacter sp. CF]EQB20630.1 Uptake hydrogenase large subunit [Dehalobacter sp. UNSWDHB]MCG1024499.1 nickel-dependent hydrogenase large subunit [Dehalobacter sp.]MDJ0307016.1 nickel-dependent hydrogenase large subunit [Dehalobacter sp.]
MTTRIVVDPVTRIEGHLRIEAIVDGTKISDAVSSGTTFRGIEKIVENRDPRDVWAFVQRICGVCTHIHAIASVRAVEDALDYPIPKNANYIRNIMTLTQFTQDHVIHFYHLHGFDWIDVLSALKADPKATSSLAMSISSWPNSSEGYFRDVQNKVKNIVQSGQLGIFANAYWGHPAYRLPPEANLMGVAHYLEALSWQKEIAKVHTVFGGKNPHPNYLVGGHASSINLDDVHVLNMERLNLVKTKIDEAQTFVNQVLIPDILAIAGFYKKDLWGGGIGNFLAYGGVPLVDIHEPDSYLFPRGIVLNRDLSKVYDLDLKDPSHIQEFVSHSWYQYADKDSGLHPWQGRTDPAYDGPKPPYHNLDESKKYSWIKTPRWQGHAMEVGPLSRFVVAYAKGNKEIKEMVDSSLRKLDLPLNALFSTLGRTLARALEAKFCVDQLAGFYADLIANIKAGDTQTFNPEKWEPSRWPAEAQGVGWAEAPRGALAHWIKIRGGKVESYQAVVPTTWNASPRDATGQKGPYEASLLDTPVAATDQPLELLRTIHSFDPCIACAAHLITPQGKLLLEKI